MANITRIPVEKLRVGDTLPDTSGAAAYTVESVRPATAADETLYAPSVHKGDILAEVQWVDGGLGNRVYDAGSLVHIIGEADERGHV